MVIASSLVTMVTSRTLQHYLWLLLDHSPYCSTPLATMVTIVNMVPMVTMLTYVPMVTTLTTVTIVTRLTKVTYTGTVDLLTVPRKPIFISLFIVPGRLVEVLDVIFINYVRVATVPAENCRVWEVGCWKLISFKCSQSRTLELSVTRPIQPYNARRFLFVCPKKNLSLGS